jgi:hypothetical protein
VDALDDEYTAWDPSLVVSCESKQRDKAVDKGGTGDKRVLGKDRLIKGKGTVAGNRCGGGREQSTKRELTHGMGGVV